MTKISPMKNSASRIKSESTERGISNAQNRRGWKSKRKLARACKQFAQSL